MSATLLNQLPLWPLITFITGLTLTFIVVYTLNYVTKKQLSKLLAREPRLKTTYTFLRKLLLVAVALFGITSTTFAAFPETGPLIASFFVAAGFISIVIGLAAQSSLSNIISGMLISITQPFRIGDAIMFKNEFCFVEDIKLSYLVLRTWDNKRLMVPN